MAYYGLAMNPNFLGGDRYISFIVGAVLEIPALIIVLFTMNTLGRKTLFLGGFLAGALCLLATLPIPEGISMVKGGMKKIYIYFCKSRL